MELFFDIQTVYICKMELFEIELFLTFELCTYAKLNCLKKNPMNEIIEFMLLLVMCYHWTQRYFLVIQIFAPWTGHIWAFIPAYCLSYIIFLGRMFWDINLKNLCEKNLFWNFCNLHNLGLEYTERILCGGLRPPQKGCPEYDIKLYLVVKL